VRPSYLMQAIQREIVEQSDAIVLTEAGNSFSLGSHHLRFPESGRYRVSTGFGSMGQATAGVLGAALARDNKAFAIVGDGAMLMLNELNTAAKYNLAAVWIVLNDARYGMIEQGMESVGWTPFETDFPRADFVDIARAMGADGVRVEREDDVIAALQQGLAAQVPFVIDVIIDPTELAPAGQRNKSLAKQGLSTVPAAFPES
jgi:acetolactate synthase I/II/III large subunit